MSQPAQKVIVKELGCTMFAAVMLANAVTVAGLFFFMPTLTVQTRAEERQRVESREQAAEAVKLPAKIIVLRDTKTLNSPFNIHAGREFPYKGTEGNSYKITNENGEADFLRMGDAELRTASGELVR